MTKHNHVYHIFEEKLVKYTKTIKWNYFFRVYDKDKLPSKIKEEYYDKYFKVRSHLLCYLIIFMSAMVTVIIFPKFIISLFLFGYIYLTILILIQNYYLMSPSIMVGISMNRLLKYRSIQKTEFLEKLNPENKNYIRRIAIYLNALKASLPKGTLQYCIKDFSKNLGWFYRYYLRADKETYEKVQPMFKAMAISLKEPHLLKFLRAYGNFKKYQEKSEDYIAIVFKEYKSDRETVIRWIEAHLYGLVTFIGTIVGLGNLIFPKLIKLLMLAHL